MANNSQPKKGSTEIECYLKFFGKLPESGVTPELVECAEKFVKILDEYGRSLRDAVCLLDPISRLRLHSPAPAVTVGTKNRTKRLKAYTNPHTGEVVYSKAGNLRILREWRKQYGAEAVLSWRS
ncbi:histone-like nucleoid-structuring protein, MvaT/MvaU family [Pseudomonas viridiflava]|uniref:histone-like nucleoid-structuring protein, MvaT/MvaU family n=1 Tax=Pseudomonas viridiflava TaxID=33069 RepID=UPI0013DFB87C|nr:histone-like nucleoid-structuring protein, MvaT/MvaU family [Pseudomonas viridiflava]